MLTNPRLVDDINWTLSRLLTKTPSEPDLAHQHDTKKSEVISLTFSEDVFSGEISHDSLYLVLVQTRAFRDLGDVYTLGWLLAQEVCNLVRDNNIDTGWFRDLVECLSASIYRHNNRREKTYNLYFLAHQGKFSSRHQQ